MTQQPDYYVVVIGASFAGFSVAMELQRAGVEDFVIYDRMDGVGGTWRQNTYPGIGVDVMAQSYQYRDRLNPDWSRIYAKGDEVLAYVERLYTETGLRQRVQFNKEVGARHWDEAAKLWRLAVNGEEVTARFVVVATGPFPDPKPTEIKGLDTFKGVVQKSASWDHSVDLTGKRVAMIGTGASAVQIIPEIAQQVGRLDVYQRTPIWIFPKTDAPIPKPVRTFFRRVPAAQWVVREIHEFVYACLFVYVVQHFGRIKVAPNILKWILANVYYRLQVPDKELRAKLTPDYDFGCKRPAVSSAYLRTFTRPNVDLVTDPIDTFTEHGIRTVDGAEREIDVVVLATGFRLYFDPQIYRDNPVVGRDGFDLAEFYQHHKPLTYHGFSIPGLPNSFNTFGHYGWTGGTHQSSCEVAGAHIARVIGEAKRLGAVDVEVKLEAAEEWTEQTRSKYSHSLFVVGRCSTANSYYFDHNGESAYIRPMTTQQARKEARTFPLRDYAFSGKVAEHAELSAK